MVHSACFCHIYDKFFCTICYTLQKVLKFQYFLVDSTKMRTLLELSQIFVIIIEKYGRPVYSSACLTGMGYREESAQVQMIDMSFNIGL
jgi:hypothetical protein